MTLLGYLLSEVIKYQCSKVDTSGHRNMSSEHYISILGYLQTEVIKYQFSKVDKSGYRNMSSEDYISTV